jgi:hypothetical protein
MSGAATNAARTVIGFKGASFSTCVHTTRGRPAFFR